METGWLPRDRIHALMKQMVVLDLKRLVNGIKVHTDLICANQEELSRDTTL